MQGGSSKEFLQMHKLSKNCIFRWSFYGRCGWFVLLLTKTGLLLRLSPTSPSCCCDVVFVPKIFSDREYKSVNL